MGNDLSIMDLQESNQSALLSISRASQPPWAGRSLSANDNWQIIGLNRAFRQWLH
jgi:hypothetical protein